MSTLPAINIEIDACWNRIGVWSPGGSTCPELARVVHCHNCKVFCDSGRRVLQREPPPGYRAEWTRILAQTKTRYESGTASAVVFRLGNENLALPSNLVREITEVKSIHRLPHARKSIVRGLVNIRGELQICVSLGSLLGLDKADPADLNKNMSIFNRMVVIAKNEETFVFPVTEVHGTHRYNPSELGSAPATLAKAKAAYTTGVLTYKELQVGVLDHELLFYSLSKGLA